MRPSLSSVASQDGVALGICMRLPNKRFACAARSGLMSSIIAGSGNSAAGEFSSVVGGILPSTDALQIRQMAPSLRPTVVGRFSPQRP